MKITEIALHHKITVFTGLLLLVFLGIDSYMSLPRESAPDIPIPIILVSTVYNGVSPEDIEKLITIPLEKKLKELTSIEEIASTSAEGFSMIRVEFTSDIDLDQAIQKVREKVDLAKPDLPEDVEESQLTEINMSEFPILVITFTGESGILKFEDLAEKLSDKVEMISGVLDAKVSGGREREIQVLIDPERLSSFNLTLNDVVNAIAAENVNIPGGTIDINNMKFMVRVPGEFKRIEELLDIVIKAKMDSPIFIRDVASVEDSFKDRQTYARFNGVESITLTVRKRAGENTVRIIDEIKKLLNKEKKRIPQNINITLTFDASEDIKSMVNDLENSVLSGVILIVAVIFFFMGFRNSIFVALAIPFSMLLTFMIVHFIGFTLNMVVLFSLILAVGMLVDNAIVIVENIYRHREEGYSLNDAALIGTSEVGWAVTSSTLTTIAAFFPLIFWPDIVGEFMKYLPKTVIIVLLSSLFIAFVANPVFCAVFMNVKKTANGNGSSGIIYEKYEKLLIFSLKHKFIVLSFCFALLIGIIVLYGMFGKGIEFFPESDPRRVYIDVNFPEGTTLSMSNDTCKKIENILLKKSDIRYVITNVGSQGDQFSGGGSEGNHHLSRILLEFYEYEKRKRPSTEVLDEVRKEVYNARIAGADIRFNKEQEGPPQDAPVKIEISGDDFEVLGDLSEQIKREIIDINGLCDVKYDYESGRSEFRVIIDREKASRFKLSSHAIAMDVRTAIYGIKASSFRDQDEEYDITVKVKDGVIKDMNDISKLYVSNIDGELIRLSKVAEIKQDSGWGAITRKNNKRTVSITANNKEGVNVNALLNEVKNKLNDVQLPSHYFMKFSGQKEEQDKNQAFIMKAFKMAIFLILFILVTEFNSITMPLVIMISVLLSLFGVFTGLLITQTSFGIIMTGIGVISLAGIVVNNAIVLIDYTKKLRDKGLDTYDAVIKAGRTRLRPVLLTAITTIVGLIPLTTGYGFDFRKMKWVSGSESSDWWGPMGVAVIFGLLFSTLLTLIVVPILYTIVEKIETYISAKISNYFHSKD